MVAQYRKSRNLVGKDTKVRLAQLTAQLVGNKYKLGEVDCFSVVYQYLKMRCPDLIPDTYKGYNINTYKNLYKQDKDKAKELMIDFVNCY